jgi:hypothetical protein
MGHKLISRPLYLITSSATDSNLGSAARPSAACPNILLARKHSRQPEFQRKLG